jgi:hypothetical protein
MKSILLVEKRDWLVCYYPQIVGFLNGKNHMSERLFKRGDLIFVPAETILFYYNDSSKGLGLLAQSFSWPITGIFMKYAQGVNSLFIDPLSAGNYANIYYSNKEYFVRSWEVYKLPLKNANKTRLARKEKYHVCKSN